MCLVYRQDKDGTMGHTGISLGDGTVVDARGTSYGVLHETVEEYGRWTHWGIPVGLYDYLILESEEEQMKATVIGGTLMLRSASNTNATVMERMPEGSVVSVLERGDEWCKVKFENKTGYSMTKYLSFEETVGEYDVVIHCGTAQERELLLA
jgi:uncharacterized protein with GYD domain